MTGLAEDCAARNHKPRSDADPHMQCRREADVELRHRVNECEPGAHGSLRVMLMRLRVTEIGNNTIAGGGRDDAAEPTDYLPAAAVIIGNDGAQILGIQS